VLEVGTEAFGLEGDPDCKLLVYGADRFIRRAVKHTEVLGHSVGLEGEGVELVGVDGELLLDGSEGVVVNEEKDLGKCVSNDCSNCGRGDYQWVRTVP
jgi:hypothetical protein